MFNLDSYKVRGFEHVSNGEFRKALWAEIKDEVSEHEIDEFNLKFDELYNDIKLPKRKTRGSAGYDFFAPYSFDLAPNESILLPTGIKSYMLEDEVLELYPRGSIGFKHFGRLANTVGIVDSDYYNNSSNEGHIFIKLKNEGAGMFSVEKGDSVVQGIFKQYLTVDNEDEENLEDRTGGFGSTGK